MRHGALIETGAGLVGVDEACSGIRSFQASVMMALFLGELFRYGFFRRLFLLVGAVAFAFSCNVVRTTYLVRTCDLKGLSAVNLHHDQAGFAILGVTLAGLLVLAWLLRPRKRRQTPGTTTPESALRLDEQQSQVPASATVADTPAPARTVKDSGQRLEEGGQELEGRTPPLVALPIGYLKGALVAVLLWIILVEAGIELWFRSAEKQAASQAPWTLTLPTASSEFQQLPISATVRQMLSYDEGIRAEWRDVAGRTWQLYYLRWLPPRNRYRATEATVQARGHAPDVCLRYAGMILVTNLGTQTLNINGVPILAASEQFLARGRPFHVVSCYWEPGASAFGAAPEGSPSTGRAIRTAISALKARDRGRAEKRVLKMGVWDMESDEAAQTAVQEYLQAMIAK